MDKTEVKKSISDMAFQEYCEKSKSQKDMFLGFVLGILTAIGVYAINLGVSKWIGF